MCEAHNDLLAGFHYVGPPDKVDGVKQVAEGVHSQPTRKRRRCAWLALPDGYADFFNQHYLDHFGISAEQAQNWAWI
jgi:hypothetical protein